MGLEDFNWEEYFKKYGGFPSWVVVVKEAPLKDFISKYSDIREGTTMFPRDGKTQEIKAILFKDTENKETVVINLKGLNILQLMKYRDFLVVQEMQSGEFLLSGNLPEEYEREEAAKQRKEELRQLRLKRGKEYLWDTSGDDLSLLSDMW